MRRQIVEQDRHHIRKEEEKSTILRNAARCAKMRKCGEILRSLQCIPTTHPLPATCGGSLLSPEREPSIALPIIAGAREGKDCEETAMGRTPVAALSRRSGRRREGRCPDIRQQSDANDTAAAFFLMGRARASGSDGALRCGRCRLSCDRVRASNSSPEDRCGVPICFVAAPASPSLGSQFPPR